MREFKVTIMGVSYKSIDIRKLLDWQCFSASDFFGHPVDKKEFCACATKCNLETAKFFFSFGESAILVT